MADLMSRPHFCKSRNIKPINQDVWSDQHRRLADEKQALSDITRVADLNTQYDYQMQLYT